MNSVQQSFRAGSPQLVSILASVHGAQGHVACCQRTSTAGALFGSVNCSTRSTSGYCRLASGQWPILQCTLSLLVSVSTFMHLASTTTQLSEAGAGAGRGRGEPGGGQRGQGRQLDGHHPQPYPRPPRRRQRRAQRGGYQAHPRQPQVPAPAVRRLLAILSCRCGSLVTRHYSHATLLRPAALLAHKPCLSQAKAHLMSSPY